MQWVAQAIGRYKYTNLYTSTKEKYKHSAVIFMIESIRRIGKVKLWLGLWSVFYTKVAPDDLLNDWESWGNPIECLKYYISWKKHLAAFMASRQSI